MKSGSNLEKVLKAGHFAFTAELDPPRGTSADEVKENASMDGVILPFWSCGYVS